MINPINPPIEVGWNNKQYLCDLSLGQLALVEGEAGIAIVYPAPEMLWQKPEAYQRGVLLYAMLKPHAIPTATLAECMEAVVGEQRDYYLIKLQRAMERLQPKLRAILGLKEEAPADPLGESNGGQNSGLAPVSTSESLSESFGT